MKNKKHIILGVITALLLIFLSSSVFAQDGEIQRLSLKGLERSYVSVEFTTPEINELQRFGLSKEAIRTDVELELRRVGIDTVSKLEELIKIPGMPQLMIQIAGCGPDKEIGLSASIQLAQSSCLSRDPNLKIVAYTWSKTWVGYGTKGEVAVGLIRNMVKSLVDSFTNAYLSVNPKGGNQMERSLG